MHDDELNYFKFSQNVYLFPYDSGKDAVSSSDYRLYGVE
jgi:hypothetical protein